MKQANLRVLQNHRGHTFFSYDADAAPVVVDCGAHKGEFCASVSRSWGATGHAIEANPVLFKQMTVPHDVRKHHFAICDHDRGVVLHLSANLEASSIVSGNDGGDVLIPSIGLRRFLDDNGLDQVDVLKMDIEGGEVACLNAADDETLCRISQISVEFHDFCGYVSPVDVKRIRQRLRRLGFAEFKFSFWTNGDILFLNRRFNRFGPLKWLRVYLFFIMPKGIGRMRRRYLDGRG